MPRSSQPIPSHCRRLAVALLLAAAIGACWRPAPRRICADCNVVLIVIDTLRADHLASYGYARQTSPFLDAFANRGVQFLNARSPSNCTYPSVNSLLTSRHPSQFSDSKSGSWPGIPERIPTLAQILRRGGYATAAVSASPVVRNTPSIHNPVGAFGQGFDRFDEHCDRRPATCVTLRGKQQLETLAEPFFLYLHYFDPHDPYWPARQMRGRFAGAYRGAHDFVPQGDSHRARKLLEKGRGEELTAEDMSHLADLYDEEILTVDAGLAAFSELWEKELLARTIVVVTSDHGEEFLEHGVMKHCNSLYDTETRVPLLMHIPSVRGGVIHETYVELLDLVPTFLDYLGIDGEAPFAGASLRPLIEQGVAPRPFARSTYGPYRSINDQRFKLIWELGGHDYELFDLKQDPAESRNIVASQRRVFSDLRRELERWVEASESRLSETERLRQAEEAEAELRALGYLP